VTEIRCPKCGTVIELDEVFEKDIEERALAAERSRHQSELDRVKTEADKAAAVALKAKLELAEAKRVQDVELATDKLRAELELKADRDLAAQTQQIRKLTEQADRAAADAKSDAADKKALRDQLTALTDELRAARKARDEAELTATKKLADEEAKIRDEARKAAGEEHRLRQLELEKKLADTQKALTDAQRKAEQGSQQNQGEVLELDLEQELRQEFPIDDVHEVKKGQRGADITQVVKNQRLEACGLLLWETKNARWQPAWTAKFRQDIREAGADIGILVSAEMPDGIDGLGQVDGVWVVTPRLALTLASAMRAQIIAVHQANNAAKSKDERMEILYQFLTGPDFRHRIEAVVENYGMLQAEIEKEKRAATLRWARQEKAVRAVIDNTYGLYGDLQGLTGGAMTDLLELEADSTEE